MNNSPVNTLLLQPGRSQPKLLWFLIATYSMVVILANWFSPQWFYLAGLYVNAAVFTLVAAFLLSTIITEVYGDKQAYCTVWCASLLNIFFILYGRMITYMPNPSYAVHNNVMFDRLLAPSLWFVTATGISYLLAAFLAPYLMAKTKLIARGRFLISRMVFSTLAATLVNSVSLYWLGLVTTQGAPGFNSFMPGVLWSAVMILAPGLLLTLVIMKTLKKIAV